MAELGINDTNGNYYKCIPNTTGNMVIIVTCLALPFHILMIKILAKDIRPVIPRQRIMLCLSASDGLQLFGACITTLLLKIFDLTTQSPACGDIRKIAVFSSTLTAVVSSLTLVMLSIERMTVCMYYEKYHTLFSERRTKIVLYCFWAVGTIISTVATILAGLEQAEIALGQTFFGRSITVLIVFLSAIILTFVQGRLFVFSRRRMTRVIPAAAPSSRADLPDFKKRQMRIAFVAGIVSAAYIVCMVPLAIVLFLELLNHGNHISSAKAAALSLALVNTLADPFIYGFGLTQTRQILKRYMKSIVSPCCQNKP